MTDKPKPKRRWWQYSLRTLRIVVTVFCVWMGITVKRARDQQRIVEFLQTRGAFFKYAHEFDASHMPIWNAEPPGPDWLRSLIGPHYFDRPDSVALGFNPPSRVTDADLNDILPQLEHLKTVRVVVVYWDRRISEEGIRRIAGLNNLEKLGLGDPQTTDARIDQIRQEFPNGEIHVHRDP